MRERLAPDFASLHPGYGLARVALQRAGHLTRKEMIRLQAKYLREADAESRKCIGDRQLLHKRRSA